MRLKNYFSHAIVVVLCVIAVSCIDDSYRLDQVSTEITIGQGTTTVPLGYLEPKKIGDMLAENAIEGLEVDENGNYHMSIEGQGDTFTIEGVSDSFQLPDTTNPFSIEIPQFKLETTPVVIDETQNVVINSYGGLETVPTIPGVDYGEFDFYLPDNYEDYGIEIETLTGEFKREFVSDDMHMLFDVPEQIKEVNRIYFKEVEAGHHGAPMKVKLDFKDLAGVNGGGKVEYTLKIEGGTFHILDINNGDVADGTEYSDTYEIEAGSSIVEYDIYIESITTDSQFDADHHLDIPLKLSYDAKFEIEPQPGYFSLDKDPEIGFYADFEYGDADVTLDTSKTLFEYHGEEESNPMVIDGLPDVLKSLNKVTLDDNSEVVFYADGLDRLGNCASKLDVEVHLPDYLVLHKKESEAYEYDEEEHIIRSTLADLAEGMTVLIEALDFGDEGLMPENGAITLDFTPEIIANFTNEEHVFISELVPDATGKIDVMTGIHAGELGFKSIGGKVDYRYDINQMMNIGGMGEGLGNIEIVNLGISPVIVVNIENPLTIPAYLSGSIVPSVSGEILEDNALYISKTKIDAATVKNGTVKPRKIKLVMASEDMASEFEDEENVKFIELDVADLMRGSMPDTIELDLSLAVDDKSVYELYIQDSYTVKYDYGFDMELSVTDDFEINYSNSLTGLNSVFSALAEYDLKVGDVALIATVHNTTPLALDFDAEFRDADGHKTKAKLVLDKDTRIAGSKDGEEEAVSTIRLGLNFGEDGLVSNLGEVDAVALSFSAESDADGRVALNAEQYISTTLQLELAGGITIDLGGLMDDENEEF